MRTVPMGETAGAVPPPSPTTPRLPARHRAPPIDATSDFDAFYRREFATLAVLAGTVAGNRSVGEDLAQEALSKVHQHWAKVSSLDKPGAWARRVAINLAIGRKRRFGVERRALRRIGPATDAAPESRSGDPQVWAAVEELPPRQRAVVALRYLDDRSVAEIAEILEISVSAATSNLHKARTNLAITLGANQ